MHTFMVRKRLVPLGLASLVASAALLPIGANATTVTLTTSQILGDFNGVIFGNFSSPSDVEGSLVVGGNLSAAGSGPGNLYTNPRTGTLPTGFSDISVYGNASGTYHVDNSGTVQVGGRDTADFAPTTVSSAMPGSGNMAADFAAVGTGSSGLSAQLAALTANSTVPSGGLNQVQLDGDANATNDLDVFSLTAAQLEHFNSFDVNIPSGFTAVFNVDGGNGNVTLSGNFLNESNIRTDNNIVWNFLDTDNLDFTTQWGGVILAPGASVTNSTPIEGVLVAGNYDPTSELHDYAFNGTLPARTVAVPEPAVLGMFGLGLLLIGGFVTLRRRQSPAT